MSARSILAFEFLALTLLMSMSMTARGDDFPAIYNDDADVNASPMPAAEAAHSIQVPDGFRVDLFAAEPEVQNPIAMAWDQQGRMWVAENYTYSNKTQQFDLSLRDRVLIFTDTDNDGRADSRKVFTDQVQMLTSVELGRGGVWLMCPPQLLFIPDADQDDVPDGPAQVILDGFTVAKSNYHNFANGLRWGPDGWLYGRCGHSCPGRLGIPGTPDEMRVPIDGGMWRYHPEQRRVEVLCHGTVNPWGHDWDVNGELFFINTVIGHVWHSIPGAHFKESFGESMNPRVFERIDTIADHYHFDTQGGWTSSRGGKANHLGGGHAHIGMMIYQGGHWPARYQNQLFTLNMHGRRANVEKLERRGAGYVARHEPDFLLAQDPFFRGLEISMGPDGNVFVLDWSDTGECHEHSGVHRTSGRIFKVSYGAPRPPQPIAKPTCLDGQGPLPELWKRYQAGQITPQELRQQLRHPDEHVRVWAIRLLTDFWPLDTIVGPRQDIEPVDDPVTRSELLRLAREDRSGLVLLTLASTLQRLPVEHRSELAIELVKHSAYAEDHGLPAMVWYGSIPIGEHDPEQLVSIAEASRWPKITRWITRQLAAQSETQLQPLEKVLRLTQAKPAAFQVAALRGMHDAFRGWRQAPRPKNWNAWQTSQTIQEQAQLVRDLNLIFGDGRALAELRDLALDSKVDLQTRKSALQSFIAARPQDLKTVCEKLLNQRVVNVAAAQGLATLDDPKVAGKLARSYRRFQPTERPMLLEMLVSRAYFAEALLDEISKPKGSIPATDLTAVHARQIRSLNNPELQQRLREVWGELRDSPAERKAEIQAWRNRLTPETLAEADLRQGRLLYQKQCSQCHMLYGEGEKMGPDLTGSQRSSLDYLLENILDPSAVVGKDYRMSVVETVDGRTLSGLIVSNDKKRMVLQTQTDRFTLGHQDIENTTRTSQSAMPDGLLTNLSPEQVRNLFGYLMHPSQVPLP